MNGWKKLTLCSVAMFCLATGTGLARAAETKSFDIDTLLALADVGSPTLSADGRWLAWVESRNDLEADKSRSRIFMTATDGSGEAIALTAKAESSSSPAFSPDGRWLAFLSARAEGETQVWTLDLRGGEAQQLTDTLQSVSEFHWSPDGERLLLVLQDPKPQLKEKKEQGAAWKEKNPGPHVIDREYFKEDYIGYLDRRRTHLYVFDLKAKALHQLTGGDFDDENPAWSPDGSEIAFSSKRSAAPDLDEDANIWVVSATPQAKGFAPLRQITEQPGYDNSPSWSPDGLWIAHTSVTAHEQHVYGTQHLAVSAGKGLEQGGETRILTANLDRMIFRPRFTATSILFLLEDSGEQALARMAFANGEPGAVERLIAGREVVQNFEPNAGGDVIALTLSRPDLPAEAFLYRDGQLAQRSFANRELLADMELGTVLETQFQSADGTPVEGFILQPPGFKAGRKYPTLLDIHGGPQSQYDWSFSGEGQLLAAQGYLVLHPNPRGSTGYGQAFCAAIWRDWASLPYQDVMAAVDDAIARGWADPERLGVMGWSYGGILTNHVIVRTDRFKAAISGASEVLYVVNYGHDQYLRWWEQELGQPWEDEARARYEAMSPFNDIENVKTPTLVLGGEEDWNVPIINSEQLYLALKRLGIETQLIVYPGEYHGIATPSNVRDLYQRYIAWFEKRVKG